MDEVRCAGSAVMPNFRIGDVLIMLLSMEIIGDLLDLQLWGDQVMTPDQVLSTTGDRDSIWFD